jgi:hypothetical protein
MLWTFKAHVAKRSQKINIINCKLYFVIDLQAQGLSSFQLQVSRF